MLCEELVWLTGQEVEAGRKPGALETVAPDISWSLIFNVMSPQPTNFCRTALFPPPILVSLLTTCSLFRAQRSVTCPSHY
ncbi:hypothetical protein I79_020601 [Cricetulus griseus]|uniref:Uncharacterized protein n=1 Tax=Cricetulus griseus TaxID=10029 RepID=G3IAH9_CRIGR|nr:hypothetical protein I79_020601 [Cricetulus griseus]